MKQTVTRRWRSAFFLQPLTEIDQDIALEVAHLSTTLWESGRPISAVGDSVFLFEQFGNDQQHFDNNLLNGSNRRSLRILHKCKSMVGRRSLVINVAILGDRGLARNTLSTRTANAIETIRRRKAYSSAT